MLASNGALHAPMLRGYAGNERAPRRRADGTDRRQVQRREFLGGQHLGGRSEPVAAIAVQQQRAIGEALGQRRIMQRRDDAGALAAQRAKHLEHLELMMRIEVIGRFIQQVDLRLLGQQ